MNVMIESSAQRERSRGNTAEDRTAAMARLGFLLSAASEPVEAARSVINTALEFFQWDASFLHLYDAETDMVSELANMDIIDGRRTQVPAVLQDKRPSPLF